MSATIEDVRQRFDHALTRLDRMAEQFDRHLAERHRREAEAWRADDAERERVERDQVYADAGGMSVDQGRVFPVLRGVQGRAAPAFGQRRSAPLRAQASRPAGPPLAGGS